MSEARRVRGKGPLQVLMEVIRSLVRRLLGLPDIRKCRVHGRVVRSDGSPVAAGRVTAYDRGVGRETALGSTTTDSEGRYRIRYSTRALARLGKHHADMVVRLTGAGDAEWAVSPLLVEADCNATIDLVVRDGRHVGPPLYSRVERALAPLLPAAGEVDAADVAYLSAKSGEEADLITDFLRAGRLARESGLDAELVFGLLRMGLPSGLRALTATDAAEIELAIGNAVDGNVIAPPADIAAAVAAVRAAGVEVAMGYVPGQGSLGELLDTTDLTEAQQRDLLAAWQRHEGTPEVFWRTARSLPGFDEQTVESLQLTLRLGVLTQNHAPLVALLRDELGPQPGSAIRRAAGWTVDDWEQRISRATSDGAGIPASIPGETPSERKKNYARSITWMLEESVPTAFIAARIQPEDFSGAADVKAFLDTNPEFDFATTSIDRYLETHPEALGAGTSNELASRLRETQRLCNLAPQHERYDVLPPLLRAGVHSAIQIRSMGETPFLETYGPELGIERAQEVYANASQTAGVVQNLFASFSTVINGPAIYAVPDPTKMLANVPVPAGIANWSTLFGSLDFCTCEHCRSVYSPAAYLVDLQHFLEERKKAGRTALAVLSQRRPDLQHIELTCHNTNTTLPYVDLVNEVLENAVAGSAESHQTVGEATELEVYPEHLNPAAYDKLRTAEVPWSLPFDLWWEEARVYLDHLGVHRYEIMERFRGSSPSDEEIAAERLGLTDAERAMVVTDSASDLSKLSKYWRKDVTALGNASAAHLLEWTGLDLDGLKDVLRVKYVKGSGGPPVVVHGGPGCSLDKAKVHRLTDPAAFDRLHRVVRLCQATGLSLREVDAALRAHAPHDLTDPFVVKLGHMRYLQDKLAVQTIPMLGWWANLDTVSWARDEPSLYEELFLNKAVSNPPEMDFALTTDRTELEVAAGTPPPPPAITKHAAVIQAALKIKAGDLALLVPTVVPDVLNLANLSALYRHATLAKALELTVSDLLAMKNLSGVDPFDGSDIAGTRRFVELVELVEQSGFTVEGVDYLLRHASRPNSAVVPTDKEIGQFLDDLRTDLDKIATEYRATTDPDGTLTANALAVLFATSVADKLLTVVDGTSSLSESEQHALIDAHLADKLDAADAKTKLVGAAALDKAERRFAYALAGLQPYLMRTAGETLVKQKCAAELGLDLPAAELLLGKLLKSRAGTQLPASLVTALGAHRDAAIADFLAPMYDTGSTDWTKIQGEQYRLLDKIASLVTAFTIPAKDLEWVVTSGPDVGWLDVTKLPLASAGFTTALFAEWERMARAAALEDEWPSGQPTLFAILGMPYDASATEEDFLAAIRKRTRWPKDDLAFLSGAAGFSLAYPAGYQGEDGLLALRRLDRCFETLKRIGSSAQTTWTWAAAEVDSLAASEIRRAVKAKYDEKRWLTIAKPLRADLRERQRKALVAYLLHDPKLPAIKEADDLFGHFLIDAEMSPCMITSRIKQAISSVQLFVQRALMGLERDVRLTPADEKAWAWMKNYRVWEANRKIFLYAENWVEPELRDDKSPFFQESESELRGQEITKESVERVFLNYLEKLDEVAQLEIAGLWEEDERDLLHVFGRTKGSPHVYYYRRWVDKKYWTPWERVDLDIEGDHLIPVVYNRRLHLFWPLFKVSADASVPASGQSGAEPQKHYEIKLAWSEYKERKWQPKTVSDAVVEARFSSFQTPNPPPTSAFGFRGFIDAYNDLYIIPEITDTTIKWEPAHLSRFRIGGCRGGVRTLAVSSSPCRLEHITGTTQQHMMFVEQADSGTSYPLRMSAGYVWDAIEQTFVRQEMEVLESTPGTFRVMLPHQRRMFASQSPFFYADDKRTFFVVPRDYVYLRIFGEGLIATEALPLDLGLVATTRYGLDSEWLTESGAIVDLFGPPPGWPAPPVDAISVDASLASIGGRPAAGDDLIVGSPGIRLPERSLGTQSTRSVSRDINAGEDRPPGGPGAQGPLIVANPQIAVALLASFIAPICAKPAYEAKVYDFQTFFHPYVCRMVKQLNRFGVAGLLDPDPAESGSDGALARQQVELKHFHTYKPSKTYVGVPHPVDDIDFSRSGAYSIYNWELFFHLPFLLANGLSQNLRFADAQKWYHFIFDPTNTADSAAIPARFWKIRPFFEEATGKSIRELMLILAGDDSDPASRDARRALEEQVDAWRDDPFKPHVIARLRQTAYQKAVVMKYIDNLIAWGDASFRLDTIESINEATQLYVLAAQILGRRPREVAIAEEDLVRKIEGEEVKTYHDLQGHLDRFSNALVDLETLLPAASAVRYMEPSEAVSATIAGARERAFAAATGTGDDPGTGDGSLTYEGFNQIRHSSLRRSYRVEAPTTLPLGPSLFFCIPHNSKLMSYWDTVADRLFKIRHCMNIEGIVRQLPLFQPPIDPALLVRAAAAGVDITSVLSDLYAPMPLYRFRVLSQKATELAGDVRSLGGALLAALEKKDAEGLALLRSKQELKLLQAVKDTRKEQARAAAESLAALQEAKEMQLARQRYYQQLADTGLNAEEQQHLDKLESSHMKQEVGQGIELGAAVAALIPEFDLGTSGAMGSPVVKAQFGGRNVSEAMRAAAQATSLLAAIDANDATMASVRGGHARRAQEWGHQLAQAGLDIKRIEKQIAEAEIRKAIAEKELSNHERQIDNAKAVDRYMRDKYTNQQLYGWIVSQISTVYFQSYQLAYDLAKQAERAYQQELAVTGTTFVQFGYWDSLKKGLLAGEKLHYDIKRMEVAYLEKNKREHEITRNVSLARLDPVALLKLRETGRCEFSIPEMLYDLDYPGHFLRRLKAVSLSIPAVVGPFTSVNSTLSLLGGKVRTTTTGTYQYAYPAGETSPYRKDFGAVQSIAASGSQNESGMFEFSFRDDRYLPFEGAGAISDWSLELADAYRQFDYDTIADVILHIRYTARDGGSTLKDDAVKAINKELAGTPLTRMFSARHQFPDEWRSFFTLSPDAAVTGYEHSLDLALTGKRFPFSSQGPGSTIKLREVRCHLKLDDPSTYTDATPPAKNFSITLVSPDGSEANSEVKKAGSSVKDVPRAVFDYTGDERALGTWILKTSTEEVKKLPASLRTTKVIAGTSYDCLTSAALEDVMIECRYVSS